jgi:acetyl esterase/lipase
MKRPVTIIAMLATTILTAMSQQKFVLPVWPDGPKESNGVTAPEVIENQHRILNISEATLTVQLPEAAKSTGAAVVICPGGGYIAEAVFHEGYMFADWLNSMGIAGIILKYRLPNGHTEIPLTDAKQAMRIVRAHAAEWHIDPGKVAIAGFSAGGHLASTLGTHFDAGDAASSDPLLKLSTRPDLMILFYPVITMKEFTHGGSRKNLLGDNPSTELITLYSNELNIKDNTPPTILLLSDDDKTVPPANSIQFYEGLKAKKIPASMYIFPEGGHGWGMRTDITFLQQWQSLLQSWFVKYGYTH